jgi:hypothetical protein
LIAPETLRAVAVATPSNESCGIMALPNNSGKG